MKRSLKIGLAIIENMEGLKKVLDAIGEKYLLNFQKANFSPKVDKEKLWNSYVKRTVMKLLEKSPQEIKEHFLKIEERERNKWIEELKKRQGLNNQNSLTK